MEIIYTVYNEITDQYFDNLSYKEMIQITNTLRLYKVFVRKGA